MSPSSSPISVCIVVTSPPSRSIVAPVFSMSCWMSSRSILFLYPFASHIVFSSMSCCSSRRNVATMLSMMCMSLSKWPSDFSTTAIFARRRLRYFEATIFSCL